MKHQNLNQRSLLIVDDEPDLVDVLVDEFQSRGIKCVTAFNGIEALAAIAAHNPDAILSDINMPKMSGLELLGNLRAQGVETPLVYLTAYGDKSKVTQALRMGALDFHEKPYDGKVLRESIDKALELGVSLKTLSADLDELSREIEPHNEARFRQIKRQLLITVKLREVYFKVAKKAA